MSVDLSAAAKRMPARLQSGGQHCMSLLNNDSRAKVRGRGGRVVAGGWHSEGERESEDRREIER